MWEILIMRVGVMIFRQKQERKYDCVPRYGEMQYETRRRRLQCDVINCMCKWHCRWCLVIERGTVNF